MMLPDKEQKELGREKLQRIIEMCNAIETHTVDPFSLNVDDLIHIVKEYFPKWVHPEELNLDAEAIHHIASVIKLQSEWVKHRSTSLYTDPFLLEEKIRNTQTEAMVNIFLKAWHPLVELEQLSIHSLTTALRYWQILAPIAERWKELLVPEVAIETTTRDELIQQHVLGDKAFSEELENYWQELKQQVKTKGQNNKIPYWDFIGAETYGKTVQRAFITSFLITYGYATLEIYPIEEEIFIKPNEKPAENLRTKQGTSIPITVTFEEWEKWKRSKSR
ncbi:MAG: hypothetical protein QXU99_05935 [Candidatus Bathyarchaeia archaeon]